MTRILALLLLVGPVMGGELQDRPAARAPACEWPVDAVVAMIEKSGGEFIGLVSVNGKGFDQLLVADFGGAIVAGGFYLGCAVGGPIPLGPSQKRIGV